MKKENFLKEIQQAACIGGKAEAVWTVAVNSTDSDSRWEDVVAHADQAQLIESFARVFGVELPAAPARKRLTAVESLTRKIEKNKANLASITNPEWKKQSQDNIREMEARLEKLMKLES